MHLFAEKLNKPSVAKMIENSAAVSVYTFKAPSPPSVAHEGCFLLNFGDLTPTSSEKLESGAVVTNCRS